jgi:Ca2+-binding RTX toxin-like protein
LAKKIQSNGRLGEETFLGIRARNHPHTVTGRAGTNSLSGGMGNGTMSGNSGQDNFVLKTALNALPNKDVITDCSPVDDTLTLENAIFAQFGATGSIPAGTFVANAGGVAADANDFLLYDTTTGELFYDADGNGAGAKVEFVTLVGIPALTAADFMII